MNKLKISMQNCFGITKLNTELDFSKCHTNAIYASNGSMKTSFTNTFKNLSKGQAPEEKIHGRAASCSIKIDEQDIAKENIFVIEPFDENYIADGMSTLLVNQEMKGEYDEINRVIEESKAKLIISLNKNSKIKKEEIERQILLDFGHRNIYECLKSLTIGTDTNEYEFNIQYSMVFDDKVIEILTKEEVRGKIKEYVEKYNTLLDTVSYYKKGVFNPAKADSISKSLAKEKYFDANNSILLNGQTELIKTAKELSEKIENDRARILANEELKKISDIIIGSVAAVKAFQEILESNPEIAIELENLAAFRKKIWLSYFRKEKTLIDDMIQKYDSGKSRLLEIEQRAKIEETKWFEVKEIFKQRFDVPFEIIIKDQKSTILGTSSPNVVFTFTDSKSGAVRELSKPELQSLKTLSQGERRAFYLMYVIFQIESRRKLGTDQVFIIDDVADSFDYKNKYAIIEYLKDISETATFYSIILTHNYDFYRTVQSRILGNFRYENAYFAAKDEEEVKLLMGGTNKATNPFEHWKKNMHNNNIFALACIPFVRNIIEYIEGDAHQDYCYLTSLLHIKTNPNSFAIKVKDLKVVFNRYIKNATTINEDKDQKLVIEWIFETADAIAIAPIVETAEIETKVVLSIATRLRAEKYMLSKISDQSPVTGCQTGRLYDRYKKQYGDIETEKGKIKLLGAVNLMTPENIHLNSFMYEPLLDMSNRHLVKLYKDIENINNEDI